MSNMSYCRFRNTRNDMSDCLEAVQYKEHISEDERRAATGMFTDICDMLEDEGVIEEYDKDRLQGIFNDMCNSKNPDEDEDEGED